MTDLTTRYLGLYLKNPLVAASSGYTGSLEHLKELEKNGIGAIVLKSIFEEEIINDYHQRLNADDRFGSNIEFLDYYDYDLKEESLNDYIQLIKDAKHELSVPIIASVNCVTSQEWTQFAVKLQDAGADALELNIFIMPTDTKKSGREIEDEYIKIAKKIKSSITIPVAIKMSPYFSNVSEMIQKLDKTVFRATCAAVFLVDGLIRAVGFTLSGFYTSTVLLNILFALPIMFFAMYIGNHLHTNITQRVFQKAIGIFLIFSGFALLFK
jgi:dihydroorotate dehydrogenase